MSSRFVPKQSQDWFVKESLSFRFDGNLTPPPPLCKWRPVSHPNWPRSPWDACHWHTENTCYGRNMMERQRTYKKHEQFFNRTKQRNVSVVEVDIESYCFCCTAFFGIFVLMKGRILALLELQNRSRTVYTETPATVWTFPVDHHTPPKPQLQCCPSTQRSSCQ